MTRLKEINSKKETWTCLDKKTEILDKLEKETHKPNLRLSGWKKIWKKIEQDYSNNNPFFH